MTAALRCLAVVLLAFIVPRDMANAQQASDVVVESAPRWAASPAGAWTPYVVTVSNNGPSEVTGTVVLRPNPEPQEIIREPAVVALGGTSLFRGGVYLPQHTGAAVPAPPVWPSHRLAVTLAPGATKQLPVMILEAPFGYVAELRDELDRVVASESPGTVEAARRHGWSVAVLTSADIDTHRRVIARPLPPPDNGRVVQPAISSLFTESLAVTQLRSATEVPEDPLQLAGLQAIVISDFDSASLSAAQLKALTDFVGLGGSLVLGGGTTWARTLAAIPDELLPMRPMATVEAPIEALAPMSGVVATDSLASLYQRDRLAVERATADVAARTSVPVAVGELRHGRVLVETAAGVPLVTVTDYGLGHVVQTAYDPFSEVFTSQVELADLGLKAGLGRAPSFVAASAPRVTQSVGLDLGADQLWSPVTSPSIERAGSSWPSWPRWSAGVLGVWILVAGPAAYALSRRRRPRGAAWAVVPALAVVVAGCGVAAAGDPGRRGDAALVDNIVELRRHGPRGTALVTTFHGVASMSAVPIAIELPRGTFGSTVLAQPDVTEVMAAAPGASAFAHPVAESRRGRSVDLATALAGGAVVDVGPDGGAVVRMAPGRPGEVQTVHTLAMERDAGGLEVNLQLTRMTGQPDEGALGNLTITGTVTNLGDASLRNLRIYMNRRGISGLSQVAVASIAADVPPGGAVDVQTVLGVPRYPTMNEVDFAMEAASTYYPPGQGHAVIVATTDTPRHDSPAGSHLNLSVYEFPLPGLSDLQPAP